MSKVISIKSNDIVQTLPDTTLQEIVTMVFWDQQSDMEIASHFNMSKPTFYKLKRTSRFQNALKGFGEVAVREANTKIQAASEKAVKTLIGLLDSDNPAIRLKASIETIRLSGLGQPLPEFTPENGEVSDKLLVLQYLKSLTLNSSKTVTSDDLPSKV